MHNSAQLIPEKVPNVIETPDARNIQHGAGSGASVWLPRKRDWNGQVVTGVCHDFVTLKITSDTNLVDVAGIDSANT